MKRSLLQVSQSIPHCKPRRARHAGTLYQKIAIWSVPYQTILFERLTERSLWSVFDEAFPIGCLTEPSVCSVPYDALPIVCLTERSTLYASQSIRSVAVPIKRSLLYASQSVPYCRRHRAFPVERSV